MPFSYRLHGLFTCLSNHRKFEQGHPSDGFVHSIADKYDGDLNIL